MSELFAIEAKRNGWTLEQSVTTSSSSSIASFTTDTVHINDLGSKIYNKYIQSIFINNAI